MKASRSRIQLVRKLSLQAKNIEILEHFIRTLTEKMHQQKPNSCVLWYDSVIKTGELKWQNSLNDLNR